VFQVLLVLVDLGVPVIVLVLIPEYVRPGAGVGPGAGLGVGPGVVAGADLA